MHKHIGHRRFGLSFHAQDLHRAVPAIQEYTTWTIQRKYFCLTVGTKNEFNGDDELHFIGLHLKLLINFNNLKLLMNF